MKEINILVRAEASQNKRNALVSDNKLDGDVAVLSANNYYPFGMLHSGNSLLPEDYTFGFNGKEMDNDIAGTGNIYDYGFRIYNPRIAKFLSVDPLTKSYPMLTPFQYAANSPVANIDLDGLENCYFMVDLTKGDHKPDIAWWDDNQHNSHGPHGQGIYYLITTYDDMGKITVIPKMVRRKRTWYHPNNYGFYYGDENMRKWWLEDPGEVIFDYDLPIVDAVDLGGFIHDNRFDRLGGVKGFTPVKNDWSTTPADLEFAEYQHSFRKTYNKGDTDPFNGQLITSKQLRAALGADLLFSPLAKRKKYDMAHWYYVQNNKSLSRTVKFNKSMVDKYYNAFILEYFDIEENVDLGQGVHADLFSRKAGKWKKVEENVYRPIEWDENWVNYGNPENIKY